MPTKFIITIKSALSIKYGPKFAQLDALFNKLIAGDAKNGLTTELIYIDDAAASAKYGFTTLTTVTDKAVKDIFDQIYFKSTPEYMAIFGAQDVFPFQELNNLLYHVQGDADQFTPSDLPYACDGPYSTDCNAFNNPTRVVGRIPDIPGEDNIDHVTVLVDNILASKPSAFKNYLHYFAVTADVWTGSTQQSVQNIFANYSSMQISPPATGGHYKKSDLKSLSHFFNCHGALNNTNYYGQKGGTYPVSLKATDLDGNVSAGTVVAAECCYGAQLLPSTVGISIASNYLKNKAVSFMGSSTIAYGPATGQGLADLICQYFMINVHQGASCGRALLDARQKFLSVSGPTLDPHELKTVAQFYILGDPSVQPVLSAASANMMNTITNRRMMLQSKGLNLGLTVAKTHKISEKGIEGTHTLFTEVLGRSDFAEAEPGLVFEIEAAPIDSMLESKALNPLATAPEKQNVRFHVYSKKANKPDLPDDLNIANIRSLVIKESAGEILGWREYVSR